MSRIQWKQVEVPKPWSPLLPDEELIGAFGGTTVRNGSHGQYQVVLVHTRGGSYIVSGTDLMQRIDAADLEEGEPVRIVWKGRKDLGEGRYKKLFELYVPANRDQMDRCVCMYGEFCPIHDGFPRSYGERRV